jgi:hypothetical protein
MAGIEIINLIPQGFNTYGNQVIGYVKDSKLYLNSPALNIIVGSEDDIEELTDIVPPGTRFFLAGSNTSWQLGSDGTIVSNEIPGTFYIDPETMNLYYTTEVE